jgi:hypothetical protein
MSHQPFCKDPDRDYYAQLLLIVAWSMVWCELVDATKVALWDQMRTLDSDSVDAAH